MKSIVAFALASLTAVALSQCLPAQHAYPAALTHVSSDAKERAASIPPDQIAAAVEKQYSGDGLSVSATEDGARLRCVFQKLEGELTRQGFWLASAITNTVNDRFRVMATSIGRAVREPSFLSPTGRVEVTDKLTQSIRPGLIEEYSVSMDGVRQDFLLADCVGVSGTDLYTGGYFTTAGGISANFIAKWNGNSWSALGLGMNNNVFALAASGSNLYVGGADFIVKWNESNSWAPLSSGIVGPRGGCPAVYALTVSGTNLYAGGEFTAAGSAAANYIAKWDGRVWSALGLGLARVGGDIPAVYELAVSDTNLYAGGWFTRANGLTAKGIARWNGSNWSALGSGIDGPSTGLYPAVYALLPSGTSVYAAGYFTNAGGTAANAIAKWNGSSWSALGSGMERSDGAPTFVGALAMSGSDLYAGGSFITAGGNVASNIAKWNGSSWSALGSGLNGTVSALAGADGDLYAGGDFTRAGGIRANYIAKWNGNSWSALDSGMDLSVGALALSGTDLYAGGNFETAGGTPANHIAKWDGTSWSALGAGTSASVSALAVWGSDVYAGGSFTMAGAIAVHGIAKWNGSAWTALGSGMGGPPPGDSYPSVRALAVLGSDLYAGVLFTTAGGKVSAYVARACLVAPPGGIADSIMQSGGRANLKFYGNPGHGFDVQRTTSLNPPITWTTITTGPLSPAADGSFTFTDTDAPPGTAYYRVVER